MPIKRRYPILILCSTLSLIPLAAATADEGKDESGHGKRHNFDRRHDGGGHNYRSERGDHDYRYEYGRGEDDDRGDYDYRGDHAYRSDLDWDVYGSYEGRRGGVGGRVGSDRRDDHYVLNQGAPCGYDDCYHRYDHREGYGRGYGYEPRHYAPIHVPNGHRPPPGECKVWIPGLPPGHQGPPTDCYSAEQEAHYYGGFVVYGGPPRN